MKVLLHTCCAVCLHGPVQDLMRQGHDPVPFFHNPNIHPLTEFRRRLKAFKVFAEGYPIEVYADERYGLREFLDQVDWRAERPRRCATCYAMRLAEVAREVQRRGCDAFTTTLLISPMQDRDAVLAAGREAARREDVRFLEADWRPLFETSNDYARRRSLYHQQYCGCIFSEHERYAGTRKHLYRAETD